MLESITAASIFSEIMMQRPVQSEQAILLLEGVEDIRALDYHISRESCMPIVCNGREALLGAMVLVNKHEVQGVGALTDGDYGNHIVDPRISTPGVFATEMNDLDSELIHLPGLADRIAYSHGDGQRLSSVLETNDCNDVLEAIHRILAPVTHIKHMSASNNFTFAVSDFPIAALYHKGNVCLKADSLPRAAASRLSGNAPEQSVTLLESWLCAQPNDVESLQHMHNGHLLIACLHALLKFECGYSSKAENLGNSIRGAATWIELSSLACIKQLTEYFQESGIWIWRSVLSS